MPPSKISPKRTDGILTGRFVHTSVADHKALAAKGFSKLRTKHVGHGIRIRLACKTPREVGGCRLVTVMYPARMWCTEKKKCSTEARWKCSTKTRECKRIDKD